MTLTLALQPASPALTLRPAPQVCYVLLTIGTQGGNSTQRAVSWALLADASRSMRIPIISEADFRKLVRAGGAHEVLVDGVPVWQFSEPVPPAIDANSPSALDYVARALYSVVEHLYSSDRLALVACAEDVTLLAPSTSGSERGRLRESIGKLKSLSLGEETDLARGLRRGLHELLRHRDSSAARVERLILLTDGFTRDTDACLALARQAAAEGIAVSTLGLGGDFQDALLMALADISGGRAVFVRQAEEIPHAVEQELAAARSVAARAVTLTLHLSQGVTLRRATSISPTLALLEPHPAAAGHALHLGGIEQGKSINVLLELLAPPAPAMDTPTRRVRLARLQASSEELPAASLDLVATYSALPAEPPDVVLDAAARANAARMQRRALEAAASGEREQAVALLRAVAERLHDLGEPGLAHSALQEADTLEHTGQTSRLGAKELTYATRRLGKG